MSILNQTKRKKRQAGNAMVEVALMAPWIFFLFVGIFDFGFYAFGIICTENAARAAAMQTAASTSAQSDVLACNAAWKEMNFLPNIASLAQNCSQLPLQVVQRTLCAQGTVVPSTLTCEQPCVTLPPPAPGGAVCADCATVTSAASSQVCVTYQSSLLIPIPGLLTKQLTITRSAEMRILAQ